MTKTATLLFATAMMFTASACDTGDDPVVERSAEIEGDNPDAVDGAHPHDRKAKRAAFAAKKLCEEVSCSDEQAAAVEELFDSHRPERDLEAHEARKAARAEANAAIAAAFRAEEFDPAVLERHAPERDVSAREDAMIAFAGELHGLLTPEQRGVLADRIAERGPMFLGPRGKGHHGPRGKGHHGPEGEGPEGEARHDPAARLAHRVDRLCERLSCTEEQASQLTATFQGVHEAHVEAKGSMAKPDFGPVADVFRAESFDGEALRVALAATRADHEQRKTEHGKEFGAVVAEIHDILTPEQRALVAAQIEEHGPHALMGGKRGKHGKHGKHGKRD